MIQNTSFCEFYKGFKDAITDFEMTPEYLYFKIRDYPVNIDITPKHCVWKSTGVVLPVHPDIDKQLDNVFACSKEDEKYIRKALITLNLHLNGDQYKYKVVENQIGGCYLAVLT